MKIHKEGYTTLVIMMLVLATALLIINYFNPVQTPVHYVIYAAAVVVFIFILRFFRNPQRIVDIDHTQIISPADGKVVVLEEAFENEYFKDKRLQVSIFMSPSNVHKNWYPLSGKIKYYRYHAGKFLVAWHPKSSELNERTTIVIQSENYGEILVRQVAGAVAQRIVCNAEERKSIDQGEELGFIKFGSRVDVFLPVGTKVLVEKNQKVKGCCDVIAKLG
ncbi:MAG TPA: phosphatidylserine decarboxylase family protein [Bacteroidales bacterium]|nr:phosphatidylserine decarboxylase family protein [Bacteroidales bacterium]